MFESEADRLGYPKTFGEPFSTGSPQKLYGIWDCPSVTADGLVIPVKNRRPQIEVRESDVVAHALVKDSKITRDADGKSYTVRDFNHDGVGMTTVFLGT